MIISTHTITEEYCEGTLVIADLETDRGGTTFSTVSAVEEITGIKRWSRKLHQTPPERPLSAGNKKKNLKNWVIQKKVHLN